MALAGGIVTGLNPCCLALYPAAAATCCASRADQGSRPLSQGAAFATGLAVATSLLGVFAALAGRTMASLGGWWAYLVAAVPLVAGAHFLGCLTLPVRKSVAARRPGVWGAFAAGLLLSLVIGPCGTPLLAAILSLAAWQGNIAFGAALLFVYGLGAGLPILILGASAARLATRLDRSGLRPWVDRATGCLLVAMGLFIIWRA